MIRRRNLRDFKEEKEELKWDFVYLKQTEVDKSIEYLKEQLKELQSMAMEISKDDEKIIRDVLNMLNSVDKKLASVGLRYSEEL